MKTNKSVKAYELACRDVLKEFEEELASGELANSYDNVEDFMKALNSQ